MQGTDYETMTLLLQEIHRLIKDRSKEFLRQNEISLATIMVLRRLDEKPGLTVSEISRDTNLSKGYVSVRVDQFEREGYVHKFSDKLDQRLTRLELTDAGQRYWYSLQQAYRQFFGTLLRPIPAQDIPNIILGLERLREALRA